MKRIFLILALALPFALPLSAQTTENLLEAGDLGGWTMFVNDPEVNPTSVFSLNNSILRIEGQPYGFIRTNKIYENYVLSVAWRWPEAAANSGIFVYVQDDLKLWPNAIECQLAAGRAGDLVLLGGADMESYTTPEGASRPNIPMLIKGHDSSENPVGEWNTAVITSINGNLSVVVNGVLQNVGVGSKLKNGHIALQSEGGPVEFSHVILTVIP